MVTIFQWDSAKAERNERKHGIAFEDAKDVFVDDTRLDLYRGHEHGEPRWLTIGLRRRTVFGGGVHVERRQ
jgi:uncharacterized DUF497 family protein